MKNPEGSKYRKEINFAIIINNFRFELKGGLNLKSMDDKVFTSLVRELNQNCLLPDRECGASWGKKWTVDSFYFLHEPTDGRVFSYTTPGCGIIGLSCYKCNKLIHDKQKELLSRMEEKNTS